MTNSPPLTFYNQSLLNDEDFVSNFVARQDALETLCRRMASIKPSDDGQHQIIIGVRGMGKTSLLRRLAIEIEGSAEMSARFIPLLFREEQYNVLRLKDFWRNCGESLAEWAEKSGLDDLAKRLDAEVFSETWGDDDTAAERFCAELKALEKRAILLIDNLDLVLDALKEDARWRMRRVLQSRDGPIMVGAATQPLSEAADREAAFYEFFQPHYLEPLDLVETERCMRTLAAQRGEAGKHVIRVLKSDPGRLPVLHRLTGGNPRVLALTYRLLETTDANSAMSDLERLLDEVTPYYKARVEDYHTQLQRAIIDAIALHWDPVTTSQLSEITGVPTTTLSPQLNRMRQDGLIEKTDTSGSYSGHQIVERFLNIWYLMRHGTRRTKQRMRWLVVFLSTYYTKKELAEIDREARKIGYFEGWTSDYAHAFEQAMQITGSEQLPIMYSSTTDDLDDTDLQENLSSQAREASALLDSGVSLGLDGDHISADKVFDDLIERFTDNEDLLVQDQVAYALFNKGVALREVGNAAGEIEVYDELIKRYVDNDDLQMRGLIAETLLNKGIALRQAGDNAKAIEVYNELIARFADDDALEGPVCSALLNRGFALLRSGRSKAAIQTYDELIERYSDNSDLREQVAWALFNKGVTIGEGGDSAGEIEIYDELVAMYAEDEVLQVQDAVAGALFNKGITFWQNGSHNNAVKIFGELIARYSSNRALKVQRHIAKAMLNKGAILLQDGNFSAASKAFDDLISMYPDCDDQEIEHQVVRAMSNKGVGLVEDDNHIAAIRAFDDLIARYSGNDTMQEYVAGALLNKGFTLRRDGDGAAAIEIYDKLSERYADNDALQIYVSKALLDKGFYFQEDGDSAAAIAVYDELIECYIDNDELQEQIARALLNKGVALGQGGDNAAASSVFDELISRYIHDDYLQNEVAGAFLNKGFSLRQDGNNTAAIEVYDELIKRYGNTDDMRRQLADALINKGIAFGALGDVSRELACYEEAAALPQNANTDTAKVKLANHLINLGVDLHRAELLLLETVEHRPSLASVNLFWLYFSAGRISDARNAMKRLDDLPSQGVAIINAALALYSDNFGETISYLDDALAVGLSEEGLDFTDDLERLLRYAISESYGEKFIDWFETSQFAQRYTPIYAALKAAVRGKDQLLDVNPETRDAAEQIFRRLVHNSEPSRGAPSR